MQVLNVNQASIERIKEIVYERTSLPIELYTLLTYLISCDVLEIYNLFAKLDGATKKQVAYLVKLSPTWSLLNYLCGVTNYCDTPLHLIGYYVYPDFLPRDVDYVSAFYGLFKKAYKSNHWHAINLSEFPVATNEEPYIELSRLRFPERI